MQELASKKFSTLQEHNITHHSVTEDLHSTQIIKAVINEFINLRLFRYGQEYSRDVLMKENQGKRQQLTKLILFNGL